MIRVTLHSAPLLAALVAAVLVAACGSTSPAAPTTVGPPFSQTDLIVGTGATATTGRTATVNYTGWLYNASAPDGKGSQFDTSLQTGREPLAFVVGSGVIAGFSQGVLGMRVGGKRRVVVPPSLGYGAQGNGPVPPNATLVFEIDLLAAG